MLHRESPDSLYDRRLLLFREAVEETCLSSLQVVTPEIFDIDIHVIPPSKDFPSHHHYDIRILIEASMNEGFTVTEESHDLAWVKLDDVSTKSGENQSMIRMVEKTKRLFRSN